tara:strand:+ start:253 stop:546 length:294 start_codon:yes stop_codon:yes gene_type:complete
MQLPRFKQARISLSGVWWVDGARACLQVRLRMLKKFILAKLHGAKVVHTKFCSYLGHCAKAAREIILLCDMLAKRPSQAQTQAEGRQMPADGNLMQH